MNQKELEMVTDVVGRCEWDGQHYLVRLTPEERATLGKILCEIFLEEDLVDWGEPGRYAW